MLASVLGRTSGVIITPGGRHLHGEFFSHLFYGQPVRQFDVEQTTETDLVIRVVPDLGYDAQVRESVMRAIAQEGDVGLVVEWREVPELAPRASGKFLFTTSRLHAGAGSGEVGARLDQRGDDAANDELGAR